MCSLSNQIINTTCVNTNIECSKIIPSSSEGEILKSYLTDIRSAQSYVGLYTFSMSSIELMEALNERANNGVEVHIYIDQKKYSQTMKSQLSPLVKVHPIELNFSEVDPGHYHHKSLIVDDHVFYIGSGNFTTDCFFRQFNLFNRIEDRDFTQKIRKIFEGCSKDYTVVTETSNQKIEYWHLPASSDLTSIEARQNVKATQKIKNLIASANKSIQIANGSFSFRSIMNSVVEAAHRGVEVSVFYTPEALESPQNYEVYSQLQSAGVRCIRNTKSTFQHLKCMIIDDHTFLNGAANWSARAFKWNEESFVVLEGLTKDQQSFLKNYWQQITE